MFVVLFSNNVLISNRSRQWVRCRGAPIGIIEADHKAVSDYYRSSRPITDILNRYTCLV